VTYNTDMKLFETLKIGNQSHGWLEKCM